MTKYLPTYYEHLERELNEVFGRLTAHLDEKERKWISEWIAAGEYGLAVTGMLENLRRTRNVVDGELVSRVREIALRIGLDAEVKKYLPDIRT